MSADSEVEDQNDPQFWLLVLETAAKRLEFDALCNEEDQKDLTLVRDLGVVLGGFASAVRDQNGEARESIVGAARAHLKSKLEALVPPPGTYLAVDRSDAMRALRKTFANAVGKLRSAEVEGGGEDAQRRRSLMTAMVQSLLDLPEVVRTLRMPSGTVVGGGRAPLTLPAEAPGEDERAAAVDGAVARLKEVLYGRMDDEEVAESLIKAAVGKLGMNAKDLFSFDLKKRKRAAK
ncbi:MAG: hypothetical protein K0R38_5363 [Polyangiaceae bacterium]|jgi:hypothetical protein|nr:hypothetical protein [Polyangiaceae bacterium]